MSSRERILGRVRRALSDVSGEDAPIERTYLREHGDRGVEETADLLAENLADYRAIVHHCTAADLPATLAGMPAARGSRRSWCRRGWSSPGSRTPTPSRSRTGLSTPHELDRIDSVVTACAVAVAESGTVVLDGSPGQGRRRITLMPDQRICVVRVPDQVVSAVPQGLERLEPVSPLTWISGSSATSDVGLDRVEGVHGSRTLEVIPVNRNGE